MSRRREEGEEDKQQQIFQLHVTKSCQNDSHCDGLAQQETSAAYLERVYDFALFFSQVNNRYLQACQVVLVFVFVLVFHLFVLLVHLLDANDDRRLPMSLEEEEERWGRGKERTRC